jgi:hypothetical protein
MDGNESDVAEADAHILTFDIPDDALERAAGAAPLITLAPCCPEPKRRIGNVHPGSEADIATCPDHVRFTPESGRSLERTNVGCLKFCY